MNTICFHPCFEASRWGNTTLGAYVFHFYFRDHVGSSEICAERNQRLYHDAIQVASWTMAICNYLTWVRAPDHLMPCYCEQDLLGCCSIREPPDTPHAVDACGMLCESNPCMPHHDHATNSNAANAANAAQR